MFHTNYCSLLFLPRVLQCKEITQPYMSKQQYMSNTYPDLTSRTKMAAPQLLNFLVPPVATIVMAISNLNKIPALNFCSSFLLGTPALLATSLATLDSPNGVNQTHRQYFGN